MLPEAELSALGGDEALVRDRVVDDCLAVGTEGEVSEVDIGGARPSPPAPDAGLENRLKLDGIDVLDLSRDYVHVYVTRSRARNAATLAHSFPGWIVTGPK